MCIYIYVCAYDPKNIRLCVQDLDPEALNELRCTVANLDNRGKDAVVKLHGINKKIVPKIDLRMESLPDFYNAHSEPAKLSENARKTTTNLGAYSTRTWCVIWDDTNWWPTYALCHGLCEVPVVLGGHGPQSVGW